MALPDAAPPSADEGWLCIRTGGTGGGVTFARHDERTLRAAVEGFCAHFGLTRISALGVLPRSHVSGLMAELRCVLTGGVYAVGDWKAIAAGARPAPPPGNAVISLVPTQLQRLLAVPDGGDWLRRFRLVLLGGGPVWPELADAAARADVPVVLTYGMTETAAMVTALPPDEFRAGERTCGMALPHGGVTIAADGRIRVAGASVFRGYWPQGGGSREFVTEDLGEIDARGHLRVIGRRDAVIITGGKKVHPADVEAVLRASGRFADGAVVGVPDPEGGEIVVACFPAEGGSVPDPAEAAAALPAHARPKRFVPIAGWPRNAQGKVSRAELVRAVREQDGGRG
jgi:O-succinylbenzoic acid--CoA ligase